MLISLVTFSAQAQEIGVTPYLHPKPCDVKMDPRGFEVYTSKNCETVFLAPKAVEKAQHRVKYLGSIDACEGHNNMLKVLNTKVAGAEKLNAKALEALDNNNIALFEKYSAMAEKAEIKAEEARKRYAKFTQLPAAEVNSLFENRVTGDDLHDFMVQNLYNIINSDYRPEVLPIKIDKSIYSFTHYRPANVGEEARSILSTTIPGLEILAQPTASQVNVAHVMAQDSVSGKTELSLMGACPMVEKIDGEWVEKDDAMKDVLTVNRNYEVPMKASYSLTATLDVDMATDVLVDMLVYTHNHGLSKTQFYNKLQSVQGKSAFTIIYDEDFPFLLKRNNLSISVFIKDFLIAISITMNHVKI